jgi:hypothetical protein
MAGQPDFSRYVERHLSERALKRIISQTSPYSFQDFTGESYDKIGSRIARSAPLVGVRFPQIRYMRPKKAPKANKTATARRPSPTYWGRVRDEVHKLVCTSDPRYASLRRELAAHSGKSQTAIVGVISAYVASILGLATGAVVPLIALCLIALLRIGKNAFCDGLDKALVE